LPEDSSPPRCGGGGEGMLFSRAKVINQEWGLAKRGEWLVAERRSVLLSILVPYFAVCGY